MCRLFGFRSVIASQVHRSLVAADNALAVQSRAHPDGWGVAHYIDGAPHVTKSATGAVDCALFRRVSGIVASETVLAHVRRATQGALSVLNAHPFQYGRWVFAHNGDIPEFARRRDALEAAIAPRLARFILGDTDSERVFFLFLSELERLVAPLSLAGDVPLPAVMQALGRTVARVREIADTPDAPSPALLTLLVTNGELMVAHQGGRELYYSTWKRRCADRDTCPSLARVCEAPVTSGRVNHLVIASEPLQGDNVWTALAPGQMVAVDARMQLVVDPPVLGPDAGVELTARA
ncbi:MAG: class II glutamine amidotransferase [Deltaproteobacteria bacterium]|nr:class II glutamine amidotransferase [Deltaproteobacteria bacterium]